MSFPARAEGLVNMVKAIIGELYFTHSWEDKSVHTFPKSICSKVKVRVQLEFELAYDNVTVQHVSHYPTGIPPCVCLFIWVNGISNFLGYLAPNLFLFK